MGRRDGDRGERRRARDGRRQRRLRPPGVTMLDFQPEDLARFREMATIVGFEDRPPTGPDGVVDLRVGRPEQDQRLPGGLRLLRADPHPCRHARGSVRDPRGPHAREGPGDSHRTHPPAVGGQVRLAPGRRDQGRQPGRGRLADVVDDGRGQGRPDGGHPRRRQPQRADLGGCLTRARLVQARLGHRRQDARTAGQRQQHAGPDLGGAGRHDRAARRLPRSVLPGGLSRVGVDPAVLEARQGAVRRLGGRLRGPARARSLEVHGQGARTSARPPDGCTTSSG